MDARLDFGAWAAGAWREGRRLRREGALWIRRAAPVVARLNEATKPVAPSVFPLLAALSVLLAAHRPAFRQERPSQRLTSLGLGWLVAVERKRVTRVPAA